MSLMLPTPGMLLTVMLAGEVWLMRGRLSGDRSRAADRGSLRLLMIVIGASVALAWLTARALPQARIASLLGLDAAATNGLAVAGLVLFVAGLGLRWGSIAWLGRWFTFDVAVAEGQRVVDSGPYRYVRHPAYTGSLLSFLGLGVYGGNAASLLVLFVPIALAFRHRIVIEEAALTAALGSRYADYARRTRRLIPFVY